MRNQLGKKPDQFDQLDDVQTNELQCVHKAESLVPGSV
jgi:hypothetical protein